MLYSYEARDDGELSVSEGKEVTIVEPDGKSRPLKWLQTRLIIHRWWLDKSQRWLWRPGTCPNSVFGRDRACHSYE